MHIYASIVAAGITLWALYHLARVVGWAAGLVGRPLGRWLSENWADASMAFVVVALFLFFGWLGPAPHH